MENQSSNGRIAMEEQLIRGRDMANQLLEVIANEEGSKSVLPIAEDLVRNVLRSFTNTLLFLNTNNDHSDEVVVPIPIRDISSSTNCTKPEGLDETCKNIKILNTKNRRACYKRKSVAPTRETESSILIEDGHAWRKYGQKMTMNAKYLRSYYRCTYKNEQKCQAIKQVQRIQENPPLYRTTYYGHHTCECSLNHEIMLESASSSASSGLLCFNSTLPKSKEQPVFSSTKQKSAEVIADDQINHNQLSSPDYLHLLCDYELDFNYTRHVTMLSSTDSVEFHNV
ncbi:WRKY DNA-binding transcription factor 70-like [Gastrolobium bilobum]|uniref:WRKY DNA-binding transcription factor 70-like n=1 Tax=Gastrolobium bilobum TaxID=150636 RepID=UPI002AAFCF32|nr:WRKY DNA-binding transcription factor 70-like [Gastrolobium bilobum]